MRGLRADPDELDEGCAGDDGSFGANLSFFEAEDDMIRGMSLD